MRTKRSLLLLMLAGLACPLWGKAGGRLPIVYNDHYNISFGGIEKWLHNFDGCKYGKVFKSLPKWARARGTFSPKRPTCWHKLREVHSRKYLKSLNWSITIARIMEVPVAAIFPNALLQWRVLTPMRWATAGTEMACQLAMEHGWAINLGGGFHHSRRDSAIGFCPIADIQFGIKRLRDKHPGIKILIVDLDVHQGDGYEADFKNDPDIFVFDMYNARLFPRDLDAKEGLAFDLPLQGGGWGETFRRRDMVAPRVDDQEYLDVLMSNLPKALDQIKPDFVLFNAGTDILIGDPLGAMKVSEEGVKQRDAFVFQQARQRNIPIAMVLSGGYSKRSASAISESINILFANVLDEAPSTDTVA